MRRSSSRRWVLPSTHLLYGESPDRAAQRIGMEQLEGLRPGLRPPTVVSEVYSPRGRPEWKGHWDLSFVYRGEVTLARRRPKVWRELRFLEVERLSAAMIARDHQDVLAFASPPVNTG